MFRNSGAASFETIPLVHLTAQLLNFRPKMDRVLHRIENAVVGRESDSSPFLKAQEM